MNQKTEPLPYIYSNKRTFILYLVTLITVALSVFVFYMIFSDLDDFYKEYSSTFSGTLWLIFMLIMGNVMFCCMLWLSGKYVLKIENAEKGFIYITTWSVLGVNKTSKHPVTILKAMKYHQGYTKIPGTPAANAPWFQIKTIKGKILVIDAQGNFTPKWTNKL